MARIYTDEAVKRAAEISREDYKAIKHMNKVELTHYLSRIYKRGYEAGSVAAQKAAAEQTPATGAPSTEPVEG